MNPVVVLHPERTEDPATLRWQVAPPLVALPERRTAEALDALVSRGVLTAVVTEVDHITTTLSPEHRWEQVAATVRAAVRAAVREHHRHQDALSPTERDTYLARCAEQVIAELVAPIATGHGGSIELVSARESVVTVRLRGACHGCPAATSTLHDQLETHLRHRVPWLRAVRTATARDGGAVGRSVIPLRLRRRAPDQFPE